MGGQKRGFGLHVALVAHVLPSDSGVGAFPWVESEFGAACPCCCLEGGVQGVVESGGGIEPVEVQIFGIAVSWDSADPEHGPSFEHQPGILGQGESSDDVMLDPIPRVVRGNRRVVQ